MTIEGMELIKPLRKAANTEMMKMIMNTIDYLESINATRNDKLFGYDGSDWMPMFIRLKNMPEEVLWLSEQAESKMKLTYAVRDNDIDIFVNP